MNPIGTAQGANGHVSWFLGLAPVDRCANPWDFNPPVCLECCCVQLVGGDSPDLEGGTMLGNHCPINAEYTTAGRVARVCLPTLVPDPATHPDDEALTILPGDTEVVTVTGFEGGSALVMTDPTIAKFKLANGQLAAEVPLVGGAVTATAMGLKNGNTTVFVRMSSGSAAACGTLPVHVGGTIKVEYDKPPTFKIQPSSGGGGGGGGGFGLRGPPQPPPNELVWGWSAFGTPGGRPSLPAGLIEQANAVPAINTIFRVEVRDALGRPKKGKLIAISAQNGFIDAPQVLVGVSDEKGRKQVTLQADAQRIRDELLESGLNPDYLNEAGVVKENIAVLAGRAAAMLDSGQLLPANLDLVRRSTDTVATKHTFTGHSLSYERSFQTLSGETYITAMTIELPAMNHAQFITLERHIAGALTQAPRFEDTQQFSLLDATQLPETLTYFSRPYGPDVLPQAHMNVPLNPADPLGPRAHPELYQSIIERVLLNYATNVERLRPVDNPALRNWEVLVIPSAPISPNPNDPPPGWDGKLVTYGAMMGEIALGLFWAGDALDLGVQFFKVFTSEEVDWLVVALAGVGLAMDFAPVTALGNAATAAVKAIVKLLPPGAAQALLRMGGSLPEACRIISELLARVPAPPGYNAIERAANAAATFVNQINWCLHSALQLTMDHVTSAFSLLKRQALRHFKDEALEGLSYAVKHGKDGVIDGMFDLATPYADDVIEETCTLLPKFERFFGLGYVDDAAIRGVGAATEAVGVGSPLVKEFLEGATLNGARANLAFRNLDALRGVDGLDDMVSFLRNNRNNPNIDGCIYEGTVARKIVEGGVPTAGTLQRVSHDGIAGANRIDSTTDTLAMQIKHKTDPAGVFTPSDICGSGGSVCGDAYLAELKTQADTLLLQPVLVTNRPTNSSLEALLLARGIRHIQVPD
ncbi:MAG: hypothetical protein IT580_23950 [Verrucomicrobiales bacterium]|nr:hypothetical protein [Verrucomicrobiales bacterium]